MVGLLILVIIVYILWRRENSIPEPKQEKQKELKKMKGFWVVFSITLVFIIFIVSILLFSWIEKKNNLIIPQIQTYTVSNFIPYGKAVNDGNWIGNIDKNSGFRFTVNSENQTTAKLSIKYKSERQGGILKVNGNTENLYFTTTNGNWENKEVIINLQQGENDIEFCSGWLTDFAPDIVEITILFDNDLKKNYIAGVWTGYYPKRKGKVTITINDDMTGVDEWIWEGVKGSHSVVVNYSNGIYTISGKDWINKPKPPRHGWWTFDNFTGTIINGKFRHTDMNLEKIGTIVLLSASTKDYKPHRWRYTFNTPANNWHSTSFDDSQWQQGNAPFGTEQNLQNTRWTTSQIYIRTQFNIRDVSSISNAYFCVWHDEDVQIYLNGELALNRSGYITNYESFEFDKTLLKNGENTIAAKCMQTTGGQLIDIGIFVSTEK